MSTVTSGGGGGGRPITGRSVIHVEVSSGVMCDWCVNECDIQSIFHQVSYSHFEKISPASKEA